MRGEEGEVEELLSKSKSREGAELLEERLGKSVTCSTLLSKSKDVLKITILLAIVY